VNEYQPDYAIPPGEHLKEIIEYYAAEALGLSVEEHEKLMTGELVITDTLAEKIADYTSTIKSYWINLDRNYRDDLKRLTVIKNE
jgi:plasmid maintenance system antidote protein VapI